MPEEVRALSARERLDVIAAEDEQYRSVVGDTRLYYVPLSEGGTLLTCQPNDFILSSPGITTPKDVLAKILENNETGDADLSVGFAVNKKIIRS